MMSKQNVFTTGIFAVAILSGVCYVGFRYLKSPSRSITPPKVDQVLEDDRQTLKGKVGANEYQVYAALVRLSGANDPIALKEARIRSNDNSEWIRAGAAEALGHSQDPQDLKLLETLISDTSPTVRSRALRALSYNLESPERLKIIQTDLNKSSLSDSEKIQAYRSAIMLSTPSERPKLVQKMTEVIKPMASDSQLDGWLELTSIAPREPAVVKACQKMAEDSTISEDLQALAIRHLSAVDAGSIRTHLYGLHKDKRMKVRAAAVQSLPMACPLEKVNILREALENDKDSLVWRLAAQTAAGLPTTEVLNVLKNAEKKPHSKDDDFYLAQAIETLNRSLAAKVKDPCSMPTSQSAAN